MGTEPTAAARWMGSWPLLSLVRVDALFSMSIPAWSRDFLEATKWSAV